LCQLLRIQEGEVPGFRWCDSGSIRFIELFQLNPYQNPRIE
jgi:hypothetical protein